MEEIQTTLEEPISLRDTIENAIETTEPEVASQEVTESVKTEKPRDEHGKFAKSSQNALDDVTKAFDDNNEQEVAVNLALAHGKKIMKSIGVN